MSIVDGNKVRLHFEHLSIPDTKVGFSLEKSHYLPTEATGMYTI
jgi:hypothetical protein